MSVSRGAALALTLVLTGGAANAQTAATATPAPAPAQREEPMPTPWDGLGEDVVDAFTGMNLLWYGGAVAATGVMAFGGADQAIRVGVQRNLAVPAFGDSANYGGYVLPAIVAPATYLVALALRDRDAAAAGSAAVQALGITLVVTSVLKVGVGRPYPLNGGDPNAPDRLDHPEYARQFRPFGSAWPLPAWPSGHTSATTAIAAALTAYYPERIWVPILGYSIALAIGLGLIDGDHHWTSDVIAGGLLGHAIGYSVGSAFRRRTRTGDGSDDDARLHLVPLVGPGLCGAAAGASW
jgi:membrane-associated phospholipid phosphatase